MASDVFPKPHLEVAEARITTHFSLDPANRNGAVCRSQCPMSGRLQLRDQFPLGLVNICFFFGFLPTRRESETCVVSESVRRGGLRIGMLRVVLWLAGSVGKAWGQARTLRKWSDDVQMMSLFGCGRISTTSLWRSSSTSPSLIPPPPAPRLPSSQPRSASARLCAPLPSRLLRDLTCHRLVHRHPATGIASSARFGNEMDGTPVRLIDLILSCLSSLLIHLA
ncbi:hypothetical protein B0H15DRAFT_44771 [Mycena belliarum]|uniref:Uncharacterized protein n=1 Tax=Mycena belliarum TaxID=1033014 RepID=A0AAD6XIZ0_9AGAR|nr:hypothetical protein B0H15DRAFT_44771 [Mycena belliae]